MAKQHLKTFRVAFGNNDRRMASNRELRVASACTESGAEVFTLMALAAALRDTGLPHALKFKYVWHCENNKWNCNFVKGMHHTLKRARGDM